MKHAAVHSDPGPAAHAHAAQVGHSSRPGAWPRLTAFAVEHLLVLPIGAILALLWVNVQPETYYRSTFAIAFFVNEIAMVLFFGLMTKEIVEATAPGGVLHSWRRLTVPVIAALGAMLVPALVYVRFTEWLDQYLFTTAWLIPCAVDVAFAYFIARLIFGRHAIVPFMLLMALAANGFAFVMLGIYFPTREMHLVEGTMLMAVALAVAGLLRRSYVKSFWPYVLVSGTLSWFALFEAGFHTAFALVPVIPFLPHAPRDPGFFVDAPPTAHDPLNRFEIWARYPVQGALFLFALVNAGVPLHGLEAGMWAVPVASLVGKPLGILLAVALAVAAGLHLPRHVGWRELVVLGCIASVGFTLALFVASASMAPGQLLTETKAGVLMSVVGAALAFGIARALRVGRFATTND